MNTSNHALPRIVLLSSHADSLKLYLEGHHQGHERAAAIFFRRLQRSVSGLADSDRYLSVVVVPFEEEWISSSSSMHVDFETKHLRELFRKAEDENLIFGFAHNHPGGNLEFSIKDDLNEENLMSALASRNGKESQFISVLFAEGEWAARLRTGQAPSSPIEIRHLSVVGNGFEVYGAPLLNQNAGEIFSRQLSAFGEPFTRIMQSLRFVVVGNGGTGSPTANLLVRCGAGELILIDYDPLAHSNLNRVHGTRVKDVGENKAEILANHLNEIELPCTVVAVKGMIDKDLSAIEALSSADVIFGCTDDYLGREVLNTALYFYLQPLIDVGLGGRVGEDRHGNIRLLNQKGRISCILPEAGKCLYCQRELREDWIEAQRVKRSNPSITKDELKERYLEGGAEEAPGVAPFTGSLANLGVATLFELLVPHRRLPGELRTDNIWIDFTNMEIKSNMPIEDKECSYCGGRRFLAASEKNGYLNRPALNPKKGAR
ncbi:MAG: ThiF family adenylyltransferase [Methylobacter sp.]